MNRILLMTLFVFTNIANCLAHDTIFVLHKAVGDTIDRTEKLNYDLFPEIKNSNFKYCFIKNSGDKYYIHSFTLSDSLIISQIDTIEIKQSIKNIDKLINFHSNNTKKDSLKIPKNISLDLNKTNHNNVNGDMSNNKLRYKIDDELRVKSRLADDAERQKNYKQGTDVFGNQMHIQFHK